MLAEIGAAVGTFAALTWLTGNAVVAAVRLLGVSAGSRIPEAGVWIGILCLAAVGTIWLERGGYRRLRADPTAGGDFAWLSLCYLPVTFLPAAYAASALVELPAVVANLYLVACVLVAGWLSFYGGLERLGVTAAQFGRAFLAAFVPAAAAAVLASLVPVGIGAVLETLPGPRPPAEAVLAALALLGQGLVLRFGFGEGRRRTA